LRPQGSGFRSLTSTIRAAGEDRRRQQAQASERQDPGASVGYYLEQGFPAGAIQDHPRRLANGRLAEMPLASASIPHFR
jgi:hypothetical protein